MRFFFFRCPPSLFFAALLVTASCGSGLANAPDRTPLADKWFTRAKHSYRAGDFEDARTAAETALHASPKDMEIRVLSARIALSKLEFADALKYTEGLQTTEVHGLRGRAFWYSGDIDSAADELEATLQDPAVKDNWAREVARLARRGQGRHPFAIEGGMIASVEMPRAGPALIVPCELEGERILALVATGVGELIIDSNSRREPAWVNLRFGDRFEVKDVPALTQDLSGLSRQFGAPVKALLGVNLLRHLHVTFDRHGDQFVVRKNDASAPPDASRIPLWYVRGGGMVMRASVTAKGEDPAVLLVDTASLYPLALEDTMWKRAGVDFASFRAEPGAPPNVKSGLVPSFKMGGFDLPQVPAMQGVSLGDVHSAIDVELGGIMGAGLLSIFRVTFGDDGRFLWVEPDPAMSEPTSRQAAASASSPAARPTAPSPAAPAPVTPPKPGPKKK